MVYILSSALYLARYSTIQPVDPCSGAQVSFRSSRSSSNQSHASFQIPFGEHLHEIHRRAHECKPPLFCHAIPTTELVYAIQICQQLRSTSMRSLPPTSGLRYAPASYDCPTRSPSLITGPCGIFASHNRLTMLSTACALSRRRRER